MKTIREVLKEARIEIRKLPEAVKEIFERNHNLRLRADAGDS